VGGHTDREGNWFLGKSKGLGATLLAFLKKDNMMAALIERDLDQEIRNLKSFREKVVKL
jgi:hypothetical protein